MSDQEKLSAESFVALPSGIAIDVGATTGNSVQAGLTYDLIVIDSSRTAGPRVPFLPTLATQMASASTGPAARAPWRKVGLGAFAPAAGAAPKAALTERVFSIVSTVNLAQQAQAVASTRYQAGLALDGFLQQHCAAAGSCRLYLNRRSHEFTSFKSGIVCVRAMAAARGLALYRCGRGQYPSVTLQVGVHR